MGLGVQYESCSVGAQKACGNLGRPGRCLRSCEMALGRVLKRRESTFIGKPKFSSSLPLVQPPLLRHEREIYWEVITQLQSQAKVKRVTVLGLANF